jgi:hypothetical protein
MGQLRSHLSYANVTATIALVFALGTGGSWAIAHIGSKQITDNSVRSQDLRNNDVRSRDIRNNSIVGKDIRAGAISGKQVDEPSLGPVPNADRLGGLAAGDFLRANGKAVDSALFNGLGPGVFLRYGATIPSGVSITGIFAGGTQNNAFGRFGVSFPLPAPADITGAQVNFAPSGYASDDDPTCTGSAGAPTAPSGKVCLYPSDGVSDTGAFSAEAVSNGRNGFEIRVLGGGGLTNDNIAGTWAYTAP